MYVLRFMCDCIDLTNNAFIFLWDYKCALSYIILYADIAASYKYYVHF